MLHITVGYKVVYSHSDCIFYVIQVATKRASRYCDRMHEAVTGPSRQNAREGKFNVIMDFQA